jgi:hypothetical protein
MIVLVLYSHCYVYLDNSRVSMKIPVTDLITDAALTNALKRDVSHAKLAFKLIYDRYREKLYEKAFGMLGNEAEAKDIVQETMVSLWEKRQALIKNCDLKNYLINTTENSCLEILKSLPLPIQNLHNIKKFNLLTDR